MRAALFFSLLFFATPLHADDKDSIARAAKDLKSKDAKVRLKAIEQLAELGEGAAKPLCDAMLDTNTKVATAALAALEKAHPKLYKPVSVMVLDENELNQIDAVRDVAVLAVKAKPALSLLIARGRSELTKPGGGGSSGLPPAYVRTIGLVGTDEEECVRFFKSVASAPQPWAKGEGIKWLVAWAGDKESRRKDLLPVVKAGLADSFDNVPIIEAAGKLGSVGKPLLPALKQLKLSKTEEVRDAAGGAVTLIEAP